MIEPDGIIIILFILYSVIVTIKWKDAKERMFRSRKLYQTTQDTLDDLQISFEQSQDNLATAIAEFEELKTAYLALFCETPDCGSIKYHTFNYCTSCVTHQAENGVSNVSANPDEPKNMFVKGENNEK